MEAAAPRPMDGCDGLDTLDDSRYSEGRQPSLPVLIVKALRYSFAYRTLFFSLKDGCLMFVFVS